MGGRDRAPDGGRTWPERVAIAFTVTAAVISFLAAGGLAGAYMLWRNRDTVEITNPAAAARRGGRRRGGRPALDGDGPTDDRP